MVSLKERHRIARAGIDFIKSLGVEPSEVQPYLYQRFLRNGLDLSDLPIFREYDVSFQLNYLTPKDKKNKKFKMDSNQTYKIYSRLDFGESKLKEGFEEVVNDYFGHKSLTKNLDIQGIESGDFVFNWDLVGKVAKDGIYVENNDNIKFDLEFEKSRRKYTESVNLLDYL